MLRFRSNSWLRWTVIGIAAAVTLWQLMMAMSHRRAVESVAQRLQQVDDGGNELTFEEAESLLGWSTSTGVIPQGSQDIVVHTWRGPFKNYSLRLFLDVDHVVLSFDEVSIIPTPEKKQQMAVDNSSNATSQRGRFRDIPALLDAVEPPAIPEYDPAAYQELQKEMSASGNGKFLPDDLNTITEIEFRERRIVWYRKLFLGSFREYGRHGSSWNTLAETFLEECAAIRAQGPSLNDEEKTHLRPMARELWDSGCQDPMVLTQLREILDPRTPNYNLIEQSLFDKFRESNYPARIAYWAGCPIIGPEELLKLQDERGTGADVEGATDSPFDVTDPVDMRIVLELLVSRHLLRFDFMHSNNPKYPHLARGFPLWKALRTNRPVAPWLDTILTAYYFLSGVFDKGLYSHVAGQQATQDSAEYNRIMKELMNSTDQADEVVELRGAILRHLLLSAWHEVPENPEPATMFLALFSKTRMYRIAYGPLSTSAEFWFKQAVRRQFDHTDTHHAFMSWLTTADDGSISMTIADECLASGRFDTWLPSHYLDYASLAAINRQQLDGTSLSTPESLRAMFRLPETSQGIEALVAGYATSPPPGLQKTTFETYLLCARFFSGDLEKAGRLFNNLGDEIDTEVLQQLKLTPREIEQSLANAEADQPFHIAARQPIQSLAFADSGNSLVSLTGDGRVRTFQVADGTLQHMSPAEQHIETIAVPANGPHFLLANAQSVSLAKLATFEAATELTVRNVAAIHGDSAAQKYWLTTTRSDADENHLTLQLRDFDTGQIAYQVPTQLTQLGSVSMAAAAPVLAFHGHISDRSTVESRYRFVVWNLETGKELLSNELTAHAIDSLAIDRQGSAVVVASTQAIVNAFGQLAETEYTLKMISTESGNELWTARHVGKANLIQFLDEDQYIVTAGQQHIVRVWERETGKSLGLYLGHNVAVQAMAYSPAKRLLATGDQAGVIRIWNLSANPGSSRAQGTLGIANLARISNLTFDPASGDILTSSLSDGVIRWSKDDGYQATEAIQGSFAHVTQDGLALAIAVEFIPRPTDADLRLKQFSLQFHGPAATGLVSNILMETIGYPKTHLLPDGKSLVTSGSIATIWNLETGEPWPWGLLAGHKGPCLNLSMSQDGTRIATSAFAIRNPSEIHVWELPSDRNVPDATCRKIFDQSSDTFDIHELDLSGDGKLVSIGDHNHDTVLWEVDTGRKLGSVHGEKASISNDSTKIANIGPNGKIQVYSTETLELINTISPPKGRVKFVRWAPDDKSVYTSVAGWVHCFDIQTGAELIRGQAPASFQE